MQPLSRGTNKSTSTLPLYQASTNARPRSRQLSKCMRINWIHISMQLIKFNGCRLATGYTPRLPWQLPEEASDHVGMSHCHFSEFIFTSDLDNPSWVQWFQLAVTGLTVIGSFSGAIVCAVRGSHELVIPLFGCSEYAGSVLPRMVIVLSGLPCEWSMPTGVSLGALDGRRTVTSSSRGGLSRDSRVVSCTSSYLAS